MKIVHIVTMFLIAMAFLNLTGCNRASKSNDEKQIDIAVEKEQAGDFPLSECCKVEMQKWDKSCPVCGKKMIQTVLWDDFC